MGTTDIYTLAKEQMKQEDIWHWQSDLYLRKNAISIALVRRYNQRACVTEFVDDIEGDVWFNIPFAYLPFWHGQYFEKESQRSLA
jgi:hypothetical protein